MDFNIILGWSITLLAIAGLIVFIRVRNKNRDKRTLAVLQTFARENNSEISYYDTWDKTLIGIDNKEINRLFFIRNIPDREIRELINISEVADCRMSKTERKVKYDKETVNVIDRIELIFSFYNQKPEIALEFYNTDYDQLTLSGELQLAQKWTGIIKSIVSANQEWRTREQGKELVNPFIVKPVIHENAYFNHKKIKRPIEKAHAV